MISFLGCVPIPDNLFFIQRGYLGKILKVLKMIKISCDHLGYLDGVVIAREVLQ